VTIQIQKNRKFRIPSFVILPLAILLAFISGGLLIALSGFSPIEAYVALLRGTLGNVNSVAEVLVEATPLLLASLGLSVSSRVKMFSIGGEGQIYFGAMGAAFVGIFLGPLSPFIAIPLEIIVGFALGALWGGIAGWLKVKMNANEVIVTLMMNYIAIEFISYLVSGPWRDPAGVEPFSAIITTGAWLPILLPKTRLHMGLIIALVVALLIWWMFRHTVLGYQLTVSGSNIKAAEANGINIRRMIMISMLISGGLCGLAGVVQLGGVSHRLIEGISPGFGYTAIIISILGEGDPLGVIFATLLFSILVVGSDSMRLAVGVPSAVSNIIQALVLLFALGSRILKQRLATKEQLEGHN
jgi:ABC-type uncharacterized transport system permease subunit